MSIQNAVCDCKDLSEKDLVLAIKQERFVWIEKWGCLTWLLAIIMCLLTGLIWIGMIIGWHLGDIINPKYVCQLCNRKIKNKQLRHSATVE